jgi:Zn-dependent peptidase ImmA (M78 family)
LRNIEKIKKGNDEERLAWLACLGKVANDYVRSWKKVRSRFSKKVTGEIEAVFGVDRHDILIGGSCQAALMFGSVSPTLDVKDAINLARNMIRLYSTRGEPAQLQKFTSADPLEADEKIWDQGYNMAEVFLKSVDLPRNSDDWIDVKGLVKRLGIFVDEEFALGDHGIRAVSIAGPQHTPAILININYPPNKSLVGRRFTLAHELFHILHDRTFGKRLAIASGPWAPLDVEKRANAFAAMFLMPPDLVRKAVAQSTEPVDSWSGVLAIAHRLKTSPSATFEHLTNMGLIDESTHDRMHLELESRLEGA